LQLLFTPLSAATHSAATHSAATHSAATHSTASYRIRERFYRNSENPELNAAGGESIVTVTP
jgi:hypothetical protein